MGPRMDWTVYPESPISRLPRLLRPVALLVRNLVPSLGPQWTYKADGMATIHYSPFAEDPEFTRLYDEMVAEWYSDTERELRWRMWLLTRFALHARHLPGNFAEFGVYRGGCSRMVLATAGLDPARRLYLFDTYAGIPSDRLTATEREEGLAGKLADTSADYVAHLLSRWEPIPVICAGDVFETIPSTDTGELAFIHLDLNAAAPTRHVLEHVFDRVVPGGMVVLDDYGWSEYRDQRREIEDFLRGRPDTLVALPTGQAVLIKAPLTVTSGTPGR
jgi:O-methyltransferase